MQNAFLTVMGAVDGDTEEQGNVSNACQGRNSCLDFQVVVVVRVVLVGEEKVSEVCYILLVQMNQYFRFVVAVLVVAVVVG